MPGGSYLTKCNETVLEDCIEELYGYAFLIIPFLDDILTYNIIYGIIP